MIICSGLLHEVENPKEMVEALFLIASNESVVHVNVPNAHSFHRLLAMESNIINESHELSNRNRILQQHSVFDRDTLRQLLVEQGFEIIEGGSYFVKPFTHNKMQQLLDCNIIDVGVLDGLYEMVKYMPELGSEIFYNCKK